MMKMMLLMLEGMEAVMTMTSNWLRSSRGGRVDVAIHCGDGVSASLNAHGWWSCWLAREIVGGVVHLIDTCDIPCVFFVNVSLVGLPNPKAVTVLGLIKHAYLKACFLLQAELMVDDTVASRWQC